MDSTQAAEPVVVRWGIPALSALAVLGLAVLIYGQPRSGADAGPSALASLNALLNACSAACLGTGWFFVRRRKLAAHRRSMLTAFGFSCAFLASYLVHHAQVGSVPFRGEGALRTAYFALLIPHIIGAAVVLPLALFAIYRGWTGRIAAHRKVARIALPLWLYVSASGVVLYWMLYRL
jgi:putative membrane protein